MAEEIPEEETWDDATVIAEDIIAQCFTSGRTWILQDGDPMQRIRFDALASLRLLMMLERHKKDLIREAVRVALKHEDHTT